MKKLKVEKDFTDAQLKEFERRRQARLKGESKTYTWEEAKAMILGRKVK